MALSLPSTRLKKWDWSWLKADGAASGSMSSFAGPSFDSPGIRALAYGPAERELLGMAAPKLGKFQGEAVEGVEWRLALQIDPGFGLTCQCLQLERSTNAKLTEFNARVWSLQGQALRRMRRSVKILKMKTIIFLHPKRPEHFASVVLHRQHGMGPGAEKHRHPLSSCLYVLGWVLHAPATRNAEFCLQGCEWRLLKSKEWERVWEV